MGEILNELNNELDMLKRHKAYLQLSTTELSKINTKISKLENIISKIVVGGWD